MRIYELAKELGATNKELLATLAGLGTEGKTHSSSLDEDTVTLLREHFGAAAPAAAAAPEAVEPAAEPAVAPEAPPPEAEQEPDEPVAEEPAPAAPVPEGKVIRIRGSIVVKDLAAALDMRPNQLIAEMMKLNVLASINQRLDVSMARKVAEPHGYSVESEKRATEHVPVMRRKGVDEPEQEKDREEDLAPRAPVVTFLGHVDHGKTSLLDRIRDTAVTEAEFGGITQHIGASTVDVQGRSITFLDTPGHAAFTAMRARGANLTDIAVIIVAADDGVMPQTREAIQHARAAGVAVMVAINKIDLPGANLDRVKQQLQTEGLAPEDWGGETIAVPVSAITGEGVEHLLEMILLQSEVLELRANPRRAAHGYVIEAQTEAGMGPTANLLVTNGTLNVGDTILSGRHCGRVRALINDHGVKVKSAGPSVPVKCLGLSGVPEAGDEFRVYLSDRAARSAAEQHGLHLKQQQLTTPMKTTLESLFDQIEEGEKLMLRVILKTDTQGSVEAIGHALGEIKSDKVSLDMILTGTGNITVNDVMLASASNAVILGFHVGREPGVDAASRHEGVETYLHSVIYELIDQVRDAMSGLLSPEIRKTVRGKAEIKQVFPIGKGANIAGCLVTSGTIRVGDKVRVKRAEEVLFDGAMESLRHFQDEVNEVREAQECGIRLARFSDFDEGDVLECYQLEEVEQTL